MRQVSLAVNSVEEARLRNGDVTCRLETPVGKEQGICVHFFQKFNRPRGTQNGPHMELAQLADPQLCRQMSA